ncbi:MAG: hypothetical protein HY870_17795 [Chloroflexi bacterium]|nr:hypothetical protein [Chloroflexota bacterium]
MNIYWLQLSAVGVLIVSGALLIWQLAAQSTPNRRSPTMTGPRELPFTLNATWQLIGLLLVIVVCFIVLSATHFEGCTFLNYWWPDQPPGLRNWLCLDFN